MKIDSSSMGDRQLIQQSLEGHSRSFEVLIRRYATRGHRIAYAILRDESRADDAYQDACIRCYRYLGKFDLERPFFPWFSRIVKHSAFSQVTSLRKDEISIDMLDSRYENAFPFVSDGQDPDDYSSLQAAWKQLSAIDRRVLTITIYEDCSAQETGEILGMTAGMVRLQKYRALLRLRRLYHDEE